MTDRLKEAEKRLTNNICSEADARYLLALCKTARERLGPAGFKLLEELNQLRERVKVLEKVREAGETFLSSHDRHAHGYEYEQMFCDCGKDDLIEALAQAKETEG